MGLKRNGVKNKHRGDTSPGKCRREEEEGLRWGLSRLECAMWRRDSILALFALCSFSSSCWWETIQGVSIRKTLVSSWLKQIYIGLWNKTEKDVYTRTENTDLGQGQQAAATGQIQPSAFLQLAYEIRDLTCSQWVNKNQKKNNTLWSNKYKKFELQCSSVKFYWNIINKTHNILVLHYFSSFRISCTNEGFSIWYVNVMYFDHMYSYSPLLLTFVCVCCLVLFFLSFFSFSLSFWI